MELTNDILVKNGFDNNHPERVLATFYYHTTDPVECHVAVEHTYQPGTNTLGYSVSTWKCNENGQIVKRGTLGTVFTVEDLQGLIDLCEIPLTIKV